MMRPFQKASGKIDHVTRGAHVDFSKISHVLNERLQILNDNSEKKDISTSIPIANMLLREALMFVSVEIEGTSQS